MKTLNPLDILTDNQLIEIMHSLEHQRLDRRLKGKVKVVEQDLLEVYLSVVERMGYNHENHLKVRAKLPELSKSDLAKMAVKNKTRNCNGQFIKK